MKEQYQRQLDSMEAQYVEQLQRLVQKTAKAHAELNNFIKNVKSCEHELVDFKVCGSDYAVCIKCKFAFTDF